jgi:hypothetical protein
LRADASGRRLNRFLPQPRVTVVLSPEDGAKPRDGAKDVGNVIGLENHPMREQILAWAPVRRGTAREARKQVTRIKGPRAPPHHASR